MRTALCTCIAIWGLVWAGSLAASGPPHAAFWREISISGAALATAVAVALREDRPSPPTADPRRRQWWLGVPWILMALGALTLRNLPVTLSLFLLAFLATKLPTEARPASLRNTVVRLISGSLIVASLTIALIPAGQGSGSSGWLLLPSLGTTSPGSRLAALLLLGVLAVVGVAARRAEQD